MSDPSGPRKTAADSAQAGEDRVRVFEEADGTRWQVREMPFSSYDRRHGLSLIFWSEGAVRRVRDYPSNWYELSDHDLALLSWKT
jgi:hypothetical protein